VIIDYVGAGTSPLAYAEYKSLIEFGETIRLIPLVHLPFGKKSRITQTYDHQKLLKDFKHFIIPNIETLESSHNIWEFYKHVFDGSFIRLMNYPRNPVARLRMLVTAEKLNELYKLYGFPNVLHVGMFGETALLTMIISRKIKVPYTIMLHSSDFMMKGKRRARYLKKVCQEAAAVITVSNFNKGYLTALGVDHEKLHVVKAGIDVERFKRKSNYKADNIILYVGRLVRFKGLEYLLHAAKILDQYNIKFKVMLVGEGPLENELKDLAARLNVQHLIEFKGFVSDDELPSIYENSQIFVHPSVELSDGRRDGIPVSLMEAMSMELPVVSTYCSGIPELVEDGWNGILVRQRDPLQLAEAIRYLLENPSVAREYGKRGREKIIREHDIKKNTKRLLDIFKEVVSKRKFES
jgi:glycosyltransferase involved in cell wall biosynthesis